MERIDQDHIEALRHSRRSVAISIPAPMLPLKGLRRPFTDPDWIYEKQYDGFRCMAAIDDGQVRLRSKGGRTCTAWFPEITKALQMLSGGPHIIDGEVCVLDENGVSHLDRLQERARKRRLHPVSPAVTFAVFDILMHDGRSVMDVPLTERKRMLRKLLSSLDETSLLCVSDMPASTDLDVQVEGVIAKHLDSPYLAGVRSDAWLKIGRRS
ncbi:hypothetical protein EZ313_03035 [Ramlibacter henchirensis]|uniref:ATP-dependent DNA ligase family profile domain-containing protein n=1 Tax=Ramlibacter henchirensis TaxID=204072 RepID=A0A4Z0C2B1_9BURK|nr:hypothetical protein [Ramlibacter henchirensis]TFZ05653.1 hypothetical protein EZ313_03035 [Ramlibacter henchirensis]